MTYSIFQFVLFLIIDAKIRVDIGFKIARHYLVEGIGLQIHILSKFRIIKSYSKTVEDKYFLEVMHPNVLKSVSQKFFFQTFLAFVSHGDLWIRHSSTPYAISMCRFGHFFFNIEKSGSTLKYLYSFSPIKFIYHMQKFRKTSA